VAEIAARIAGVNSIGIFCPDKDRRRVRALSLLCFWAIRELGITLEALSRRSRIFQSSIIMLVQRGEQIAETEGYSLLNELKL